MDTLTLDSLMALERNGWVALCDQTAGSFDEDLMTEDGLMMLVNGITMDRDAVVISPTTLPLGQLRALRASAVAVGLEAAALVYRAKAQRGKEPAFEGLMSSTYILVNAEPGLALYQQTTATH
jgi:hypothetical protein